jgi:hypothetical protein
MPTATARAPQTHAFQVHGGEDQQAQQADDHGAATEEHGSASRLHRRHERCRHITAAAHELFTESADDKQAVVDGQPETQHGDDVERKDRNVCLLADDANQQERPEYRRETDRQRQCRGDKAAKDED